MGGTGRHADSASSRGPDFVGIAGQPPDLVVDMFETGHGEFFQERPAAHGKTVPHGILAVAEQGHYEIACGDGRSALLAPGEGFLTPAHLPLRITHCGDPAAGGRMRIRWLHFRYLLYGALEIDDLREYPLRVGVRDSVRFMAIARRLAALNADRGVSPLYREAAWRELAFRALRLLLCLSRPRPEAAAVQAGGRHFLPMLHHVRRHLAASLDVAHLARLCHLSPPQFHVRFRRVFGCPPMVFVKRQRLAEAARRLRVDGTLKEIAAATGFGGPFHLSREFSRAFGQSPALYRRRLRAGLA